MGFEIPKVPQGTGEHPIPLVVISANNLAESATFYSKLFGWQTQPLSAELTAVMMASGPSAALRASVPDGFPGVVPFVSVRDVEAALERVVAAGGSIERAPWSIPLAGKLARFKDPSGTIYGLTNVLPSQEMPHVPMPFGSNPKPPAGSICSLEMYASSGAAAAGFFGELFGWGSLPTMEHFMAFDPGKGIGGVFQSHTPALPAVAYIYVGDVRAKIVEIEAAGGRRSGDPMDMPGLACFGYFTDPSGTTMGLIGP
jgi:predicted enzyme related to lactoylglutathione lyase